MNNRIEKLMHKIKYDQNAFLITSGNNRLYFTDFTSSAGAVLVTKEQAYLLVDFRYGQAAKANAQGARVVVYENLKQELNNIIEHHKINKIYLENDGITLAWANRFSQWFEKKKVSVCTGAELDKLIENMRLIKSADEIDKISQAQRITEYAYNEILNYIKPGVAERSIALELEYLMRKKGAAGVSFELITIAGKNTALPHGVPTDNTVKAGDFVTMDIGALYEGYHSDMTRTVGVAYLSEKQKEVYNIVLCAQQAAIKAAKSGAKCSHVDKMARNVIKNAGYGEYFGHATGHGVGLNIHEHPRVSASCDSILSEGMVITAEPGIYLPGEFGVRIEDMLYITADGYENLTKAEKKLLVL